MRKSLSVSPSVCISVPVRFVGRVLFVLLLVAGLGAGVLSTGVVLSDTVRAADLRVLDLEGAPSGFAPFAEAKVLVPISFQDGDGKTRSLSDFEGQVVLVNYWATWCAPCVREMPSLALLQERFRDSDFKVVAISLDGRQDPRATVRAFYEKHEITSLAVYNDPTFASFRALVDESVALPYSLLIDRDGRALGELYGPASWHGASVYGFIETLLARDHASGAEHTEQARESLHWLASGEIPQGVEEDPEYFPLEPHEGGCFGDGLFPTV